MMEPRHHLSDSYDTLYDRVALAARIDAYQQDARGMLIAYWFFLFIVSIPDRSHGILSSLVDAKSRKLSCKPRWSRACLFSTDGGRRGRAAHA